MVLAGGKGAKYRKPSPRDWSKTRQALFLETLGETCNVTAACRAAGISSAAVYRRRSIDAGFRSAWRDALTTAYRRLELVLLERAFDGTERTVFKKDGSEERIREYPNSIALQLLKMHKEAAAEGEQEHSPEAVEELRDKLRRKLKRLRARLIEEGEAAQ